MSHLSYVDDKFFWMKWIYGRPIEMIKDFQREFFMEKIKEMKLKPIDIEVLARDVHQQEGMQTRGLSGASFEESPIFKRIKFPGGIIGPHFHFEGRIYLLDDRQWQQFSTDVVQLFKNRLENLNVVEMKQFAKLNDTLTTL